MLRRRAPMGPLPGLQRLGLALGRQADLLGPHALPLRLRRAPGMSGTIAKDMRPLVKRARRLGAEIRQTKGCHIVFVLPNGERVITSGTPSDHRVLKNTTAELRRKGLPV